MLAHVRREVGGQQGGRQVRPDPRTGGLDSRAGRWRRKSLRLVNKDPQRYAPILFDLLRRVCELAGIKTSPEALPDTAFDAGRLRAQMGTVREAIEDFSGFRALPASGQQTIKTVLRTAETEMPAMVGIVHL